MIISAITAGSQLAEKKCTDGNKTRFVSLPVTCIMVKTCGVTRLSVLLHAVAAVVELSKGGGELVQVVAERVEQQVVQDLLQDLGEAQDALPQLPLLLVVQNHLCGLGRFPQCGLVDVSQTSYGPVGNR